MAPKGPWSSSEVLEVATAESRDQRWQCWAKRYIWCGTAIGSSITLGGPRKAGVRQRRWQLVNNSPSPPPLMANYTASLSTSSPGTTRSTTYCWDGRIPARCMGGHHAGLLGCLLRYA